jgi:pimeloyl-ACP methyl ester carboxylesterase
MAGAGRWIAKSSVMRGIRAGTLILGTTLILGALTSLSTAAQSATRLAVRQVVSRPHVYLMRGLLNIFSLGMDQLAVQIQRHDIDANVYNHTFADVVDGQIVKMYRSGDHGPYILIGHSLGADAVMWMAQQLNAQGVPVALVVPVDGTGSSVAPRNVACVINLTQRRYAYMRPGAGFRGILDNVDLSGDPGIDHLTIDKSPRVQAEALRYVLETVHDEACRPGVTAATVARSKQRPAPQFAAPKMARPAKTASPALRPGVAG